MWRRNAERRHSLLDLELGVTDDGLVRLDHYCAGAGMHRLLGVEVTDTERALLRAGETVTVVAACDRCIWERRLVLRGAEALGDGR
jgi:hypothetical protein